MPKRRSPQEVLDAMAEADSSWRELRAYVAEHHDEMRRKQHEENSSLEKQAAALAREGYSRQRGGALRGQDLAGLLFRFEHGRGEAIRRRKRAAEAPQGAETFGAAPDRPAPPSPPNPPLRLRPMRQKEGS